MNTQSPNEQFFHWHPKGGLTAAASREDITTGLVLTDQHKPGAWAVSAVKKDDPRFIEPIGIARSDLFHDEYNRGFFQFSEGAVPTRITLFAEELMARALGAHVITGRGMSDGIYQMEWNEQGKPTGLPYRMLMLVQDGQILREESGRGANRPEPTKPAAECVRDGTIYFTTENKRIEMSAGVTGKHQQMGLFSPAPQTAHVAQAENLTRRHGLEPTTPSMT